MNIRMNRYNSMDSHQDSYRLSLNFLPLLDPIPEFTVYRQAKDSPQALRPDDQVRSYKLPENIEHSHNGNPWSSYWISYQQRDNFTSFTVSAEMNLWLTRSAIFWALSNKVRETLPSDKFNIPKKSFIEQIEFVQKTHNEGEEILIIQPYFLKITRQFGVLADFRFRLRGGVSFSRRVQQLSLSLNSDYRRNLDYCADRWSRIHEFLNERKDILKDVRLPSANDTLNFAESFIDLSADTLENKTYIFGDGKQSKEQFTGLRSYGPLKPLESGINLLFIFREQDRHAARLLAKGLKSNQPIFPGFDNLFRCTLQIDKEPFVLPDLSQESIQEALIYTQQKNDTHSTLVPILILPEDDDSYFIQKSLFSNALIASQVCTLKTLKDSYSLKWSLSNIALQIFCKAGGYPWKVMPSSDDSLIIGISQSHKYREDNDYPQIEKYFAFSIMTDNSGLFQNLQILGEGDNEDNYINDLKNNLKEMLIRKVGDFSRIVVHTSFKLKYHEITAIKDVITEIAQDESSSCHFVVMKVNHQHRFFGVNKRVNSLVPYEATYVKLARQEYLVWFEGIGLGKTTVSKAFPGPTHLEVLYNSNDDIDHKILLQDLVNLSGANWRGFNAKSSPVSVYYCHLVADFIRKFHEHGLPIPEVRNIQLWFL